jgi:imidazolonepropionase-like amidohydrolase
VDFPEPATVTGWSYRGAQRVALNDSATRAARVRSELERNPAMLHGAGVRFALASGGLRAGDFMANVRKAIAAGLPRDVALQALTLRAAEAAGVEQQLGSIDVGKIANLVVADGDILSDSGTVRTVIVDGEPYDVIPQATPSRRAGPPRGTPRPQEDRR